MKPRLGCVVFLCLSAVLQSAGAQESVSYASISGRVTDPRDAAVEGARVLARQAETNATSSATTDSEGRFRLPYLRVGEYEVTIRKPGFAETRRTLVLRAGSAFELSVGLAIEAATAGITVRDAAALLDAVRTQTAQTVSKSEIAGLPLNGRNLLDAALLAPGVSPTNTGANQLFAETSAVPGQGISVASQRNFSNSFIVDGLSNNDDASGLTGAVYGVETAEELQVVTAGGQAEFGRALGGYLNVVTRSGSNRLHGDLYGYFRNQRLDAANALSHAALPLTQSQDGATVGGPAVRDRTFYFANFERRDLNQAGLATITPASVAAINARLDAAGYSGPKIATGIFANPVHSDNLLAKLDHRFGDKDQGTIRYSLYHVHSLHSRGSGGLSAASASANLSDTDQVVAAGNVAALSPHLVNETRGQFWSSSLAAPPADPVGPAVSIAGVASFGTLSASPTARRNRLGEVVDNLLYQMGSHAIRIGADVLYNDDTITFPRSLRGSYSFASLSSFLAGTYNNLGYTQTFGSTVVRQRNPNAGFYAQDEWQVTNRLTLNLGVRYDLQFLKSIATDTNNVAPRAGFAWSPGASRRTVVRGGFGLFYDRVPLRALANALLSAGNTTNPGAMRQISVSLSPGQSGAPLFPNILNVLTLPPGVLFNFTTMDRRMQNAYAGEGNLEIEHQLGRNGTLAVGYEHVRGLRLIIAVNQNVPACAASGSNNACRPNLSYANDSQYSSLADSRYHGLHLSLLERPSRWWNYRVSYTWSKALDNVGEFFFSAPIDNFNLWRDYGRSDDDQRHRVSLDGAIRTSSERAATLWQRVSHGFQLSAMAQYYSSLPFNVTTGATTVQGTAARPLAGGAFIGRNTGSGFDLFNANASLSRSFVLRDGLRLEMLAEGFNLTNHVNGVTINGVFGTGAYPANPLPTFRQVTAVGDARAFQFALRLTW